MLDLAKIIHEAIGIDSPKVFIAVFACFGFFLFGTLGWLIDKGYRVKIRQQQAAPPESAESAGERPKISIVGNNNNATFGDNSPITITSPPVLPERTLPAARFDQLTRELSGPPALQVHITELLEDDETAAFAKQIENAFVRAGWSVSVSETGALMIVVAAAGQSRHFRGDGFHCGGDASSLEFKKATGAFKTVGLQCPINDEVPRGGRRGTRLAPFGIVIGKRI